MCKCDQKTSHSIHTGFVGLIYCSTVMATASWEYLLGYSAATAFMVLFVTLSCCRVLSKVLLTCSHHSSSALYELYVASLRNLDAYLLIIPPLPKPITQKNKVMSTLVLHSQYHLKIIFCW